ncbi:hypothetical protein LI071_17465 [Bacillus subtilis]|uniref:hypothetical protein n=1 Tax=Bacillus subtilis TaxID=1423 RepID=UPI001D06FBC2|nr:hypothetical protein [Bacillus subtilis]MCB7162448.1 hypothetical protein [Bacillus subtilis]MCB7461335.1 hypothetical protein [Bacillus subtilis]
MKYIIQLEKCTVILTSQEINTLLQKDTETFNTALKRGKYFLRNRTQLEREANKFEQET